MPIDWWGKTKLAIINYPENFYKGAEIAVIYQGLLTKVFKKSDDDKWIFNPEMLPYESSFFDAGDNVLFFVESEVLYYILTHEPFMFALHSCRLQFQCNGYCCQTTPALTPIEVDKFLSSFWGADCLDFSQNLVYIKKRGRYCFFFEQESKKCLLYNTKYRPKICQWAFCGYVNKIINWEQMIEFIRFIFTPAPTYMFENKL